MKKTTQDIKDIIDKCPNTFKAIKQYYLDRKSGMDAFITDNLIKLSISESPYTMFKYFDTVDLIGTIHFNHLTGLFNVYINGESIEDGEDWLGSLDRDEALILAVIYLFEKQEKIL